jgi:hypothetical protein
MARSGAKLVRAGGALRGLKLVISLSSLKSFAWDAVSVVGEPLRPGSGRKLRRTARTAGAQVSDLIGLLFSTAILIFL